MQPYKYTRSDAIKMIQDALTKYKHDGMKAKPLHIWNDLFQILKDAGVAYYIPEVSCLLFLVHPKNRSGLGLHPFKAHTLGHKIKNMGADMGELQRAVCFELSSKRIHCMRILLQKAMDCLLRSQAMRGT